SGADEPEHATTRPQRRDLLRPPAGAAGARRHRIDAVRPDQRVHHLPRDAAGMEDDGRSGYEGGRSVSSRRSAGDDSLTPACCSSCGTELSPEALMCPACATLVHSDQLKQLAAEADAAAHAGDLPRARTQWTSALALLPVQSQQHAVVRERVAELT